jgi:low temperature requirement protein LtrA
MQGTKVINLIWALLMAVFFLIGMAHGKDLGDAKAIKSMSRDLKMGGSLRCMSALCQKHLRWFVLGLWTATLPQGESK